MGVSQMANVKVEVYNGVMPTYVSWRTPGIPLRVLSAQSAPYLSSTDMKKKNQNETFVAQVVLKPANNWFKRTRRWMESLQE